MSYGTNTTGSRRKRPSRRLSDNSLLAPVHHSIPWSPLAPPKAGKPQGERRSASVSLRFSVRGERFDLDHRPEHVEGVSNHERKAALSVHDELSDSLQEGVSGSEKQSRTVDSDYGAVVLRVIAPTGQTSTQARQSLHVGMVSLFIP